MRWQVVKTPTAISNNPVYYHLKGARAVNIHIKCDQKLCVHLTITLQKTGAPKLFDHPVYTTNTFLTDIYRTAAAMCIRFSNVYNVRFI